MTSDRQSGGQIGSVLAINDQMLVAGDPGYGESFEDSGGAVYVFERSASAPGWVE